MMTRTAQYLVIGVLTLGLAGCQEAGQKQTLGTLLGAVSGAVAGAQVGKGKGRIAAVAAGTLVADALLLLLLVDSTESEDELQADARISINAVRVATIKGIRSNRYLVISPPSCD